MLTGLDHAIVALRSLDAAERIGEALGLHVTRGGEHPGRGTHNAIIRFGADYLEFIAVADPTLAASTAPGRALQAFLGQGEGWLGFALASDDLAGDVAAARGRGLVLEDPEEGSRLRPDGTLMSWQTARVVGSPWGGTLPFLIQHRTPLDERVSWAPAAGHTLGATCISAVSVATGDLEALVVSYSRLLGRSPDVAEDVPALPARRVVFQVGDLRLEILQPMAPEGGLADFVRKHGTGLFLVSLAVPNVDEAVAVLRRRGTAVGNPTWRRRAPLLDHRQTGGARFQLVETR